jgi:hypothetical protein
MTQDNLTATQMIPNIGNVELFWLNEVTECYQKNNLIYIRILKNASTFYTNLFIENKWDAIKFKDIDWERNQVFSFIQDPVVRYCKGITEDLYQNEPLKEKIVPVIKDHPVDTVILTYHTLPISLLCGEHMYKIKWFTLDSDAVSPQQLDSFCKQHHVSLDWSREVHRNVSKFEKINLFNNLKFLLGDANHIFWKLFAKDIDLYNYVCNQKNISN